MGDAEDAAREEANEKAREAARELVKETMRIAKEAKDKQNRSTADRDRRNKGKK